VFAVATSEFVRTKGGVFTRETSTYSIIKNDREKLVLHEVDDGSFGVDPSPNLEHRDAEEGVDAAKKFEQKVSIDILQSRREADNLLYIDVKDVDR